MVKSWLQRRREIDLARALRGEERLDSVLIGRVKLRVDADDNVRLTGALQGADDGGTDPAAVTGNEDRWARLLWTQVASMLSENTRSQL